MTVVALLTGAEAVLTVAAVVLVLVVVARLDIDVVQNEAHEGGTEIDHGLAGDLDHTAVGIAGADHEGVARHEIGHDAGIADLTDGRQIQQHHVIAGLGVLDEFLHVIGCQQLGGVGRNTAAGDDVQIIVAAGAEVDVLQCADACQQLAHTVDLIVQLEDLMLNGAAEVAVHQQHALVHLGKGNGNIGDNHGLTCADVSRGHAVDGAVLALGGVAHIGAQVLEGLGDGEGGLLIQQTALVVTVGHEVSAVGILIVGLLVLVLTGLILERLFAGLVVVPRGDLTDDGNREAVLQVLLGVDGVIEVRAEQGEEVDHHGTDDKAQEGIQGHVTARIAHVGGADVGDGLGDAVQRLGAGLIIHAEIVVHGDGDGTLYGLRHVRDQILVGARDVHGHDIHVHRNRQHSLDIQSGQGLVPGVIVDHIVQYIAQRLVLADQGGGGRSDAGTAADAVQGGGLLVVLARDGIIHKADLIEHELDLGRIVGRGAGITDQARKARDQDGYDEDLDEVPLQDLQKQIVIHLTGLFIFKDRIVLHRQAISFQESGSDFPYRCAVDKTVEFYHTLLYTLSSLLSRLFNEYSQSLSTIRTKPPRIMRSGFWLWENYLLPPASFSISAAKSSSLFSIPSPFSKRQKEAMVMEPPSSLAVLATY